MEWKSGEMTRVNTMVGALFTENRRLSHELLESNALAKVRPLCPVWASLGQPCRLPACWQRPTLLAAAHPAALAPGTVSVPAMADEGRTLTPAVAWQMRDTLMQTEISIMQ